MSRLEELILLLRSHAHEAPEHCGQLMREAARELDRRRDLVLVGELGSAPIPPPELAGKHRHPKREAEPCR